VGLKPKKQVGYLLNSEVLEKADLVLIDDRKKTIGTRSIMDFADELYESEYDFNFVTKHSLEISNKTYNLQYSNWVTIFHSILKAITEIKKVIKPQDIVIGNISWFYIDSSMEDDMMDTYEHYEFFIVYHGEIVCASIQFMLSHQVGPDIPSNLFEEYIWENHETYSKASDRYLYRKWLKDTRRGQIHSIEGEIEEEDDRELYGEEETKPDFTREEIEELIPVIVKAIRSSYDVYFIAILICLIIIIVKLW
jgi:hypothetical protein